MPRAVVKWFDPSKNFGFLTVADGPEMGTEVFVHGQDVVGNPLRDYDAVNCELQADLRNGRYRATNVSGGTGVAGDMTRPPKIRIPDGKGGPGLTAGAVDASGNAPMDPEIEALRPRKDSRCGHVSFADLRDEVIRRRRRKQRRRDRGEASSSDEGGRGRRRHDDAGRDRDGGGRDRHGGGGRDYDRGGDRGYGGGGGRRW